MNKACETGEYREVWHEMAGCDHCGTCVRWDLVDDPFWGFQTCREKAQAVDAVDPHATSTGKLTTRDRSSSSFSPPVPTRKVA